MSDIPALIAAEAQAQGVPPWLALGAYRAEGSGDMSSVSPRGAVGPMQLMPATAAGLGVDPTTLAGNVKGGVAYLKQQMDRFGDPAKALAAYNAGPGAVQKYGGVPPFAETQKYVRTAMGTQPGDGAAIFDDGPSGAQTPTPQGDGAAIFADAPQAPQAAPQTLQAAPMVAPATHTSEGLGLLKGAFAPIDHASNWLEAAIKGSPVEGALTKAGAALRGAIPQNVVSFIDDPQAFYDRQRMAGVTPGKLGEFAGNVGSTLWVPGGPLVNGAATGALLSDKKDPMGVLGDMAVGALAGKAGSAITAGLGKAIQGVTDPAVKMLADKGVPLTAGQLVGGIAHNAEDKLTSVPILGDMIRSAQARGIQGAQRAAWNDTLGQVGQSLPENVPLGHEAYTYTKGVLKDLYDTTLSKLGDMSPDAPFVHEISKVAPAISAIGDSKIAGDVEGIIKSEVLPRFKNGVMSGEDMKAAQEALGQHIKDLTSGTKWSRDGAAILSNVKASLEGLASRTDPAAGDMLSAVNRAYSYFKPLEAATAKATRTDGQFTLNQLVQGLSKGRAASTLAAGAAPHQALAGAAAQVLPSTVPDSGTAGRHLMTLVLGGLLGGAHEMPVMSPAMLPAAGLIGGGMAAYSRGGQKLLTAAATARNDAARTIGEFIQRLSAPAGTSAAVLASGARQ